MTTGFHKARISKNKKYQFLYRNYDDKCWRGSFGCKNFASFLFNLVILQLNYDVVDVAIRK